MQLLGIVHWCCHILGQIFAIVYFFNLFSFLFFQENECVDVVFWEALHWSSSYASKTNLRSMRGVSGWAPSRIKLKTIKERRALFYGPATLGSESLTPLDPIHQVHQRWEINHMMKARRGLRVLSLVQTLTWNTEEEEETKCSASRWSIERSNLSCLWMVFYISFPPTLFFFSSSPLENALKCIKTQGCRHQNQFW